MTEARSEIPAGQEIAKMLPDTIRRQLIVVRGRSGLLLEDFRDWVVRNQAQFGKGNDDYASMVKAHENTNNSSDGAKILGVHEEVRRTCRILIDGKQTEFVEANPSVRNVWVGKYVKLLNADGAANTEYAGSTALKWATNNGIVPEMVVRASNGYFYPATKKDIVISNI